MSGRAAAAGGTFGALVSGLRRDSGRSVYALAKAAGLSAQAVHDIEAGRRRPSLDTARLLARALGVTLDWLDARLPPPEGRKKPVKK
jgi:transcriptional regulator with XRE-family HTH domain